MSRGLEEDAFRIEMGHNPDDTFLASSASGAAAGGTAPAGGAPAGGAPAAGGIPTK
jgi:hypothetical protein